LRRSERAVSAYRWVAGTALPALFILVVAVVVLSAVNLGIYDLRSSKGDFCQPDQALEQAQNEKLSPATIDISLPCAPTGMWLVAGRQYRIQIEPEKEENAWFDKGTPADVNGFGVTTSGAHFAGLTLRRWWRENYFRPVARVGRFGNYEYPLHPTVPLPKVDLSRCGKAAAPADIRSPAPWPERKKILDCEKEKGLKRNEVLIADITPDTTGQLYISVNDAVLFWQDRLDHSFYLNNNGKAKVTVTRTLAPAVVDYK
jgi:hypothetical protein